MSLTVEDLSFGYDGKPVLSGIDLRADSGELLGVLGPNGSGKSTLLQCVDGILDPDDGRIVLDGDPIGDLSRRALARRAAYVPQDETGAFPASVFETVLQGRRPHGGWSPGEDDRAAVEATLDRLDLTALAARRVDELSGGQRQTVRLARALVQDPSVLLLDEPTSALDLKHQLDVMDLIGEHVRAEAVTGVVAIHDLNLAARYCDRVALLADGAVYDVGDPSILTPESIEAVYGVDASVRSHRGRRLVVPESPTDARPDSSDAPANDRTTQTRHTGP